MVWTVARLEDNKLLPSKSETASDKTVYREIPGRTRRRGERSQVNLPWWCSQEIEALGSGGDIRAARASRGPNWQRDETGVKPGHQQNVCQISHVFPRGSCSLDALVQRSPPVSSRYPFTRALSSLTTALIRRQRWLPEPSSRQGRLPAISTPE
jgi:hypothetical protein